MKLSDHFDSEEFACHCGCGTGRISMELIERLELLRWELGGRPIVITSGIRCEDWNRAVGGVTNSAHTRGTAVDIAVAGGKHRYDVVSVALDIGFRGVGVAKTFIHLDIDDVLPRPSLWSY